MELDHTIDGKLIDPKPAVPKGGGQSSAPQSSYQSHAPRQQQSGGEKIFVGGLHQSVTESSFSDYFSQFGGVKETLLMMDRDTGRPRGYIPHS
jgi:RNA-binding protein Musashi